MTARRNLHFIAYTSPPLEDVAAYVIRHAKTLPDLTDVEIILDEPKAAAPLRQALLHIAAGQNINALLGPRILTLEQWLQQHLPSDIRICTQQQRLLFLVEALYEKPDLLCQANAWTLADSLLDLFDELTLNQVSLNEDIEGFVRQLAVWYNIKQTGLAGLQHEARLVHQLWQAWHTQLQANQLLDPKIAHILALQHSLKHTSTATTLHFIGIEPLERTQLDWLRQCLEHEHIHIWWQANVLAQASAMRVDKEFSKMCAQMDVKPPLIKQENAYEQTLATIFAEGAPMAQRAAQLRRTYEHSAIGGHIAVFSANNTEQEAHAIDLQCRQWLLDGKRHIAIVTENRRLARRVRALLERADILLQDAAGWALSTTRTAATLEALLQCIEEEFAKDALLDLLKSPFLFPELARSDLKNLIYRLEHDIIHNEGITSNLAHYQNAIHDRAERLQEIWDVPPSAVSELLQRLGEACLPLLQLRQSRQQMFSMQEYLDALRRVINATGLDISFQQDAAGILILQVIDEMHDAQASQSLRRPWRDFRAWLGRNLEKTYFRPEKHGSAVELLNLNQTRLRHFDAIILAAAEHEYLPGSPSRSPFFNDAVRAQLGLTTREQIEQQRLHQFYRLLFAAPDILISHRAEQDGEAVTPSPWLAAMVGFHRLAYKDDLQAKQLHALLRSGQTQVKRSDSSKLPVRQQQPRPSLPQGLLPDVISASDYQSLLDCPYQFFASRCLHLHPPEEIRDALSKREYGERVHLCLQAFHSDLPNLPGPFTQTINESNMAQATTLLEEVSAAVFKRDLLDNYAHRGWYYQWLETIPAYIDWQMQRNRTLKVAFVEQRQESHLSELLSIKGRLDRMDKDSEGFAIIDYKTGSTPSLTEIRNGEKIQLPFYALLAQNDNKPVHRVEYLYIGTAENFKAVFPQSGDELQRLTHEISERLQSLLRQLHTGASLPAWENKETCQYCDMCILCRVGTWEVTSRQKQ